MEATIEITIKLNKNDLQKRISVNESIITTAREMLISIASATPQPLQEGPLIIPVHDWVPREINNILDDMQLAIAENRILYEISENIEDVKWED